MKPTIKGGPAQFNKDMGETFLIIDDMLENIMKKVAVRTLGKLISRSPIVTGRYVSSHEVTELGQGVSNSEGAEPMQKQTSRVKSASSTMAKGQYKIGHMRNPGWIMIENNVHYAQNVETGWFFEKGSAEGYYVYAHTKNDMNAITPGIIAEEEAKAQRKLNGV